jgi:hypothetical protein
MATIYVSYQRQDRDFVGKLVPLLAQKGHETRFDQDLIIGSIWREQLMKALLTSDVVLVIWSAHTERSQYVPAEIGAARTAPDIGIMPIILGRTPIPQFIQDLSVEMFEDTTPQSIPNLVDKIDVSIQKYLDQRLFRKAGKPKIFISHRHKDEPVVSALIDCIEYKFRVSQEDIRCTSVDPYRLRVGEDTPNRLRAEITDAEVVLGVLTTDTLDSTYVAFELGSAWGQNVWTCPLLAGGATPAHIPDPIRGLSPLYLSKSADCRKLLSDLERSHFLEERPDADDAALDRKVSQLVQAATAP